jgi:hypothetical protein
MSKFANALISPLGAAVGLFKKPKIPAPVAAPTRDDVAREAIKEDNLRKRRGGAADMLTGAGGAEAAATGVKTLVGQ